MLPAMSNLYIKDNQNVVCNVQPAYKGQSGYLRIYSLLCPTVCKVIFKVELGFCGIWYI